MQTPRQAIEKWEGDMLRVWQGNKAIKRNRNKLYSS